MNEKEFYDLVRGGLGKTPRVEALPSLAELRVRGGLIVHLRWEWIEDKALLDATWSRADLDMLDGEEWVTIFAEK